jgi:hypothetical protein
MPSVSWAPAARLTERVAGRAVATGFAWMFSGARLPAPRLVDLTLGLTQSLAGTTLSRRSP